MRRFITHRYYIPFTLSKFQHISSISRYNGLFFTANLSTAQQQSSDLGQPSSNTASNTIYTGPLTTVARRLKVFSVSSLALTLSASPLIFIADVPLPEAARAVLVSAAIFTSAASTGLVHWTLFPYVTKIALPTSASTTSLSPTTPLSLHTLTLTGRERIDIITLSNLAPSSRIFTTWMVRDNTHIKGQKRLFYVHPELCGDGLLAEIMRIVRENRD